jgi:anti-sigma factor RsiW
MMPCRSFEDLLLGYSELSVSERDRVDAHVAGCAECREYLAVLDQIDGQLAGEYSGARAPAGFERSVLARVTAGRLPAGPTWVPEILDCIGWAAVIAAAAAVAWLVVPLRAAEDVVPALRTFGTPIAAGMAVITAAWAGIRSFSDLKR